MRDKSTHAIPLQSNGCLGAEDLSARCANSASYV